MGNYCRPEIGDVYRLPGSATKACAFLTCGHSSDPNEVVSLAAPSDTRRYKGHRGSQPKELQRMNWDRIEGNWKQAKGKVKEQWGKLTDDQLDKVAGKRDQLVGKIQECYGIAKDDAE